MLGGSLCCLIGVIGVTAAFNIPLNNGLADAPASAAADVWPRYVAAWLLWNHIRTGFAVAAVACFVGGALKFMAPGSAS